MACPSCNGNTDFKCMTCGRGECYVCEKNKEVELIEDEFTDPVLLCDDCIAANYFTCESCNKVTHDDLKTGNPYQDICEYCMD